MTIFDQQTQDTHAGGSGCGCAATVLSAYILPKIERGEWERVLYVPTGALMSTVSYQRRCQVCRGLPTRLCWSMKLRI